MPPKPLTLGPARALELALCDKDGACLGRKCEEDGGEREVWEGPPDELKSLADLVSWTVDKGTAGGLRPDGGLGGSLSAIVSRNQSSEMQEVGDFSQLLLHQCRQPHVMRVLL